MYAPPAGAFSAAVGNNVCPSGAESDDNPLFIFLLSWFNTAKFSENDDGKLPSNFSLESAIVSGDGYPSVVVIEKRSVNLKFSGTGTDTEYLFFNPGDS